MKALTIWQPWATLIMAGAKTVEWRGWCCPKWIVGQRIAVHAGARPARADEIADIIARIDDEETSLIGEIARPLLASVHRKGWPLSSILGTAIIGKPVPALDWVRANCKKEFDSDRIDQHKFAWPLSKIERFEPPIPQRGAQGFWTCPGFPVLEAAE
jgi:hypothetical protein